MRLFVAIDFPAELRDALHEAARPLREAAPAARWYPAEKLHLTVKFLGEQPETVIERLVPALNEVAQRHRPMELELAGAGVFPNFRRPRVVWIGVEPGPRLELLYHDTELACERLGFEVEGRVFRPHVTIGRVGAGLPGEELRALEQAIGQLQLHETASVETLDLVHSEMTAGGSRYRVLHAAPLRED